ncbi:MAG TPA: hypothetical protein DIW47_04885 [Bacteroidetes bacterium]|nr:hypothetical protein [Bacteroidota bacterium]
MKVVFTLVFGSVVCFFSCSDKNSLLSGTEWLIGTWEIESPEGNYFEAWTKQSDTLLLGKSFAVDGKDTQYYERIQLLAKSNTLYYIPTVPGQNGDSAVTFTLKSLSDSALSFENVFHDFPTLISYRRISNDSLMAEISGKVDGKVNTVNFPMRKIN